MPSYAFSVIRLTKPIRTLSEVEINKIMVDNESPGNNSSENEASLSLIPQSMLSDLINVLPDVVFDKMRYLLPLKF